MTQFYTYNNTDLGNQVVRLGRMGPLDVEAQQEQVGSGGLDFDDPAGTLNIIGLKPFTITETAGPAFATLTGTVTKSSATAAVTGSSTLFTTELQIGRMVNIPGGGGVDYRRVSSITDNTHLTLDYPPVFSASGQTATVGSLQRLFTGYTALRSIARGQNDSLRTGAARRWSVTLDDINSFLSFRVFTESDANRPAETDLARIRWLLHNSRMAGTVYDTGDIPTTGAIAMDPADYRGQRCSDVLNDCNQVSGKNAYVYWEESQQKIGLVYDFHSSTRLSSPLRLSSVRSEIDSDEATVGATMTFPIEPDWTEHDDPSRVVAGVYVAYGSNTQAAYQTKLSTAATFGYRDAVAPTAHIKTLAKARALGNHYLADNATEDVLITGSVKLPRSVVTQLTAGLRVKVYAPHLPSVSDSGYTWCRVLRQSIAQDEESDQFYTVNMDLTPIGPVAVSGGGSFLIAFIVADTGSPAGTMPTDISTHAWTNDYWSGDFTSFSVIGCGAGPPVNQSFGIWHRAIVPGESAAVLSCQTSTPGGGGAWVYEVSGVTLAGLTVVNNTQAFLANAGTVSVSANAAGTPSVLFGGVAFGKVNYDGGWCNVTPQNLPVVIAAAGTEVANKSGRNDCGGAVPWSWQGYVTGSGTLSVGAVADCYGDCGGSYACGWNIAKAGLLIPAPGTFSILQSAAASATVAGGPFTVTLPSPP